MEGSCIKANDLWWHQGQTLIVLILQPGGNGGTVAIMLTSQAGGHGSTVTITSQLG